jgi:hypothetical protein
VQQAFAVQVAQVRRRRVDDVEVARIFSEINPRPDTRSRTVILPSPYTGSAMSVYPGTYCCTSRTAFFTALVTRSVSYSRISTVIVTRICTGGVAG